MKSYFTVQNVVIVLAWLIPVAISLVALRDSRRALSNTERESLLVQVSNFVVGSPWPFSDYTVNIRAVVKGATPDPNPPREAVQDVLVDNYWSCLISNAGHRTVSVVAMHVWRDGARDLERSELFDTPEEPAQLPISIPPGESRRLLLRTPVKLGRRAIDVLHVQDRIVNPLMAGELFNILFKAGIDHYGNPLGLVTLGGGHARFDVDTSRAAQERFELKLKTGVGNYFGDRFWWYKGPQF